MAAGDVEQRFGSMMLLSSWGDGAGISAVYRFLETDENPFDGLNPHRKAYQLEVDAARAAGREDIAQELIENMAKERELLVEQDGEWE